MLLPVAKQHARLSTFVSFDTPRHPIALNRDPQCAYGNPTEGVTERDLSRYFTAHPDVGEHLTQPMKLESTRSGRRMIWFPDYWAQFRDGTLEIGEVKIDQTQTRMAVPGEGERHAIDFREAAELTSVSAGKLRRARRRGELETRHVLRRSEVVPVLSRTEIRELADMESIGASVLGVSTHMPRYAVAQLATGGIISAVPHPFVRERYGLRIEAGSVEDLLDRLERASVDVGSEALTLTLASAMSVVGGREKPYLEVFEALLDGRLPFTLTAGCGRLTRRVRIERTSLPAIGTMTCEQTEHYDHYILDDARNVLNLHGRDARALDPHRSGTKHSAAIFDRGLVRSLAERNIALGEAALRTGAHLRTVMGILNRAGVRSTALGWDRAAAEAVLGIQPC